MSGSNNELGRHQSQAEGHENMTHKGSASVSSFESGRARNIHEDADAIDDQGTTQDDAVELLEILYEDVFDSDAEKLALALGRSPEEVTAWLSCDQTVDADVLMKAKSLIIQRADPSVASD